MCDTQPECLTSSGVQHCAERATLPAASVAREGALRLAAVRTFEEFERLGPDWQDLFERSQCTNVFVSFDWMIEWWKYWGHRRKLFIVTVRESSGRLVGLAPFSIDLPVLVGAVSVRFIADEFVGSDHLDLLGDAAFESSVVERVAGFLIHCKDQWDYIHFSDCQDTPLLSGLRKHLRHEGMIECTRPASICPYIPLPPSFDAYLAAIGAKSRKNFRRGYRSLEKAGPLDLFAVTEVSEMETRFEELIRLHSLRFAGHKVESSFLLPSVMNFHKETVKRLAARGWARLYVLEIAGCPIGALYGFSVAGRFSFYQCGRDPGWNRFGVGQVLNSLCIQEAIKTGHHEFDFLRGGENYKSKWARHWRLTVSIFFFDRRFKSRLARLLFYVGLQWRSLSRGLKKVGTILQRGPRQSRNPYASGGE